ncbi:hypothetical protein AB0L40_07960 [Patulibacter sp. NPDC049589]|uniref:hypothetical protein n=1 Tax=Patulibacter sp. NPDC049589 TaxID=3154731 RepID=UPI003418568B
MSASRTASLSAVLITAALTVAGCGSDDSDPTTSTAATAASTAATTTADTASTVAPSSSGAVAV